MAEISEELDRLSVSLIQTAIDLLEAGESVPVMLATDYENEVLTFEDDSPDGCYRAACQRVAALGADCTRYAILCDGFVRDDESEAGHSALLFEFAERGMENAWSGYLLYRPEPDGDGYDFSDPQPAGAEELLFS